MVRLPTYENKGKLDTGIGFFRTASDEGASALGRGVQNLARGIDLAVSAFEARDDKIKGFKTEHAIMDAQKRVNDLVIENKQNITEDGVGFRDQTMTEANKIVDEALAGVPAELRDQAGVRLKKYLLRTDSDLANTEVKQGATYMKTVTNEFMTRTNSAVANGLYSTDLAKQEIDAFFESQQLPLNLEAALKKQAMKQVELSRWQWLKQYKPEEFVKEAAKYMPNNISPKAGEYQRMAVETAQAHGLDPMLMLTVGQIESTWNPRTGENRKNSTIKGLYQLSRDLRRELGIPESMAFDPAMNTEGFARLAKRYQSELKKRGYPTDTLHTWSMHFLGPTGMRAIYGAKANQDAYTVYRSVAGTRIANIAFNGSNGALLQKGMTIGQVRSAIAKRVKSREKVAAQYMQAQTNFKPDENVEIMGEKFSFLTVADVAPHFAEARAAKAKNDEARFAEIQKEAVTRGEMDSSTKEGQDAIDKAVVKDGLVQRYSNGEDGSTSDVERYVERYKYLPKPIAKAAMAKIGSNDPVVKADGYDTLYKAYAENPIAGLRASGLNKEQRDRVETYAAMRSVYGMNPTDAAAEADRASDPEAKAKLSDRDEKVLKHNLKRLNWSEVENSVDLNTWNVTRAWNGGSFAEDATPNPHVQKEIMSYYAQRYESYFRDGAPHDTAVGRAIMDIKRSRGVSRIGSQPFYTMYPPEENLKAGADGTHKWVQQQAEDFARTRLEVSSREVGTNEADIDYSTVRVHGTQVTGVAIQTGSDIIPYEIYYTDRTGALQMIPQPFIPDEKSRDVAPEPSASTQQDDRFEVVKTKKVDIGKAREQRDAGRSSRSPRKTPDIWQSGSVTGGAAAGRLQSRNRSKN